MLWRKGYLSTSFRLCGGVNPSLWDSNLSRLNERPLRRWLPLELILSKEQHSWKWEIMVWNHCLMFLYRTADASFIRHFSYEFHICSPGVATFDLCCDVGLQSLLDDQTFYIKLLTDLKIKTFTVVHSNRKMIYFCGKLCHFCLYMRIEPSECDVTHQK